MATSDPAARMALQDVISRYVSQLLEGCGDATCDEMMCRSGRHNSSGPTVRHYTARSARMLAVTLASGPKPRSRLCPRYQPKGTVQPMNDIEPPRDPSSFAQQLSDSKVFRGTCGDATFQDRLGERASTWSLHSGESFKQLEQWRIILELIDGTSFPWSTDGDDARTLDFEIARGLVDGLRWFVGSLPTGKRDTKSWKTANEMVACGKVYCFEKSATTGTTTNDPPSPEQTSTHPQGRSSSQRALAILERLDFEPAVRLLDRAVAIIGQRFNSTMYLVPLVAELISSYKSLHGKQYVRCLWMALVVCLKRSFLRHWTGRIFFKKGTNTATSLLLLNSLAAPEAYGQTSGVIRDKYEIPAISARLNPVRAARKIAKLRDYNCNSTEDDVLCLLKFDILFTSTDMSLWLRIFNQERMGKAHGQAVANTYLRQTTHEKPDAALDRRLQHLEEHYLLLTVSRATVLEDAFSQLWQRRKTELLLPLRVRMSEEDDNAIGQDLGGVQIEFFNLICRELFKEDLQMFTTTETGFSYFRAGSLQPLYQFELCGVLLGLALHNGITLPMNLPLVFYQEMLGRRHYESNMISEAWPQLAKSFDTIAGEGGHGLEDVFPLEANGLRMTVSGYEITDSWPSSTDILRVSDAMPIFHHPGHSSNVQIEDIPAFPGWRLCEPDRQPVEVTPENSGPYIDAYAFWTTWASVFPQWKAFKAGFYSVVDSSSIQILSPRHFRQIMEGSTHIDIEELRRNTEYGEPYKASSRYIKSFWRIVSSWPEEKQMQLVKFVTAAERIPAAGVGQLSFSIHGQHGNPEDLPSTSTCFGTLYLPQYATAEILEEKLDKALSFGLEGFGTG